MSRYVFTILAMISSSSLSLIAFFEDSLINKTMASKVSYDKEDENSENGLKLDYHLPILIQFLD